MKNTKVVTSNVVLFSLVFFIGSGVQQVHAEKAESEIDLKTLAVVAEKKSSDVDQFVEYLSSTIDSDYKINTYLLPSVERQQISGKFVISIGHRSLNWLLSQKVTSPILATFVSRDGFLSLVSKYPVNRGQISAIYSDPDPDYQLQLINNLYDKPVSVAVLLSQSTRYQKHKLLRTAKKNNIDLNVLTLTTNDNLYKALSKISKADVLLAVPDENIYNLNTIRTIILTTNRHNQSLIGFSPGMVRVGALASVFADTTDIVDELRGWLQNYKKFKQLPKPRYARFFKVKLNQHVARYFNVYNTNATELAKAVSQSMVTRLRINQ